MFVFEEKVIDRKFTNMVSAQPVGRSWIDIEIWRILDTNEEIVWFLSFEFCFEILCVV